MKLKKCVLGIVVAFTLTLFWSIDTASGQRSNGPPGFVKARIIFTLFDANGDKALSEEEVPEFVWGRLMPADLNEDGSVTQFELKELAAARIFANFDVNEDGALTEDEVPAQMWGRLSAADADEDGGVTAAEFVAAGPSTRGGKPTDE